MIGGSSSNTEDGDQKLLFLQLQMLSRCFAAVTLNAGEQGQNCGKRLGGEELNRVYHTATQKSRGRKK